MKTFRLAMVRPANPARLRNPASNGPRLLVVVAAAVPVAATPVDKPAAARCADDAAFPVRTIPLAVVNSAGPAVFAVVDVPANAVPRAATLRDAELAAAPSAVTAVVVVVTLVDAADAAVAAEPKDDPADVAAPVVPLSVAPTVAQVADVVLAV